MVAVILLYLIPSIVLQTVYGPSYGFLSGENYWRPDGNFGWVETGHPAGSPPDQPSVNVPTAVRYVPIFLPAVLLILFLFTPMSKYIESRPATDEELDKAEKEKSGNSPGE